MSVTVQKLIVVVTVVTGLALSGPMEAQQAEPDPAPPVDQAIPLQVILPAAEMPVVRWIVEDAVRLTSRSIEDDLTRYTFDIEKHSMYVTIADTGIVTVKVQYAFTNPTELADVFPELKMDFDQFPRETSDGSEVALAVRINSNYEFDDLDEFENKLPKLFLHFDVLKDSELAVSPPQLEFGGVTPRIIIQEEEGEIPLIQIEPAQKKNGG